MGGGGGGALVYRNDNSIPSAHGQGEGRGHGGHLSLGIIFFKCRTRNMEGHLSLGTIVLIVEPGEGGQLCLFKCRTREMGSFVSRNNDSTCRTSHLSLGITVLSVE